MFLICLDGGYSGLAVVGCCSMVLAERHTLPKWPILLPLLHGAFWRDIIGGVPVKTALRNVCMDCFVLVSSVVVDVFEIVAPVGVVVVLEGVAIVENVGSSLHGRFDYPRGVVPLSRPAMARWFSCPLSLFRAYCSTCADVRVSVKSSPWISLLFLKAMNKSLIRSSSAVPSLHCAPSASSLQRKISSFSLSFCLQVNKRNLSYVVFLGRVNASENSWNISNNEIVLMLNVGIADGKCVVPPFRCTSRSGFWLSCRLRPRGCRPRVVLWTRLICIHSPSLLSFLHSAGPCLSFELESHFDLGFRRWVRSGKINLWVQACTAIGCPP